jgi:hypothetical protein
MKKNRLNWFAFAGAVTILVFGLSLSGLNGRARAAAPALQERHEGFEDMRRAEKHLREAREILAQAPGEYGGHRDKAIKRVDEALGEVHEAIEHH